MAAWDAFGGLIETPNMKRLAAQGLRYSQWHTPALSFITRSCLLAGRECDASTIAQAGPSDQEWHGQSVVILSGAATLAEILAANGYRTYCVGKWHLSRDLADMAIEFIRDGAQATPGRPGTTLVLLPVIRRERCTPHRPPGVD